MRPLPTRRYGVEIECLLPCGAGLAEPTSRELHERLAAAIMERGVACVAEGYNHQLRSTWKIVSDSSVSADGCVSAELVSPPLSGDVGFDQIRRVCEVLTAFGARINTTCGLHVHVDATDEPISFFRNIALLYMQFEPVIDAIMPRSRRGAQNPYCRPVQISDVTRVLRAASVNDVAREIGASDRFRKLNLTAFWRHGTVEFRHHSGTTDADKIISWITSCLRMADAAHSLDTQELVPTERPSVSARPTSRRARLAAMMMRLTGATRAEMEAAEGGTVHCIVQNMRQISLNVETVREGREVRYFIRTPAAPVARLISFESFSELIDLDDGEKRWWVSRAVNVAAQETVASVA